MKRKTNIYRISGQFLGEKAFEALQVHFLHYSIVLPVGGAKMEEDDLEW